MLIIGYKILNYREYFSSIENINYSVFKNYTILDILAYISTNYPDKPALKIKNKDWKTISYQTYFDNVVKVAECINCWLGDEVRVAIMGFNSPGWIYAHLGCMLNNGISIGIHQNSTPEICEYIINDSKAELLIIDDDVQLEKLDNINLGLIKLIVYYSPIKKKELVEKLAEKLKIPILSMGNFMIKRNKIDNLPTLNHVCMIAYTSGTTGHPKGVIITHKNIMSSVMNVINSMKRSSIKNFVEEQYISHLPLNQITTQMFDIYLPICTIGTVWFANKKSLMSMISNIKPTVFIGNKKVWQNICHDVQNSGMITNLTKFVYPKMILEKIGFDKCKIPIVINETLDDNTKNYFDKMGLKLYTIYGMTETTGITSISLPTMDKLGSVGIPVMKVNFTDSGEILVKGDNLFSGYTNSEKSIKNSWFNTNDLGILDKDGYLCVIGRKDDLIDDIMPQLIEDQFQELLGQYFEYILVNRNKKLLLITSNKLPDNIESIVKSCMDSYNKYNTLGIKYTIVKWNIINKKLKIGKELTSDLKIRRFKF